MFLGVLLGHLFKFPWLFPQLLRYGLFEGMVRLGRFHHAVNHGHAVFSVECWSPGSHHVHTDISCIKFDRGMVNRGHEFESWCLEWILRRKFDAKDKFTASVGRTVGALDLAIPSEHIFSHQRNIIDEWERILFELCSFLFIIMVNNH